MKKVFYGLVAIFLSLCLYLFFISDGCDSWRCKSLALFSYLANVQASVEEGKDFGRTIGKDNDLVRFGYVSQKGSVVLVSVGDPLIIVADWQLGDGVKAWRCQVFPERVEISELAADCGRKFRH